MNMSEGTDIAITNRVADLASALRAVCWPDLGGIQAVLVAIKFVEVFTEIERLTRIFH